MTERWQQEIDTLRSVRPSDDVWTRVELGPTRSTGTGLPPRRSRIVAGVVAVVVFLAAGAFAWRALRPTTSNLGGPTPTENAIVATFKVEHVEGGGSGPSATITTPNGVIDGTPISYEWTNDVGTGYFDTMTPSFEPKDFVEVPQGSQLVLDSDANGVTGGLEADGEYPFTEVVSFGSITDPVTLDQPPGRYVLHMVPSWNEGTVNYFFPIELVAPGSTSEGSASLTTVGKNAPEATLRFEGDSERGVRSEYTWCDGSENCVSGVADFASYPPVERYLQVPVGTPIELKGDATDVKGDFSLAEDQGGDRFAYDGAVPDRAGRYVLTLEVTFDRGSATFFFGVDALSDTLSPSPTP